MPSSKKITTKKKNLVKSAPTKASLKLAAKKKSEPVKKITPSKRVNAVKKS